MANIQWYPGHMAKAKRQMIEQIKQIDVVIELADCRIPEASRNPLIGEIASGKPRLLLLNKADLADPKATSDWRHAFEHQGLAALPIDSRTGAGLTQIGPLVRRLALPRREKLASRGFTPHADRALIVGIPNVGKSTLINRLAGRKVAKVGDRPGVTTAQQWIKVGKTMELLDTPGILWTKFDHPAVGLRLAATGAIKEELTDYVEIAIFLLNVMSVHYASALNERYHLTNGSADLGVENQPALEWLAQIGRSRGCLGSGGQVDIDRTAELVVRDYRHERLGRLTLEWPDVSETV
ncbi:MAG: ribosome biogenesis GTPase YlqF [Sporolactobacillus sp.]